MTAFTLLQLAAGHRVDINIETFANRKVRMTVRKKHDGRTVSAQHVFSEDMLSRCLAREKFVENKFNDLINDVNNQIAADAIRQFTVEHMNAGYPVH